MGLSFTKEEIVGDVAAGLWAEIGDGYKITVQYEIKDKAGHPLSTSKHWIDASSLLGFYEWLTLVAIYGPRFANRSLERLGFKLVPLASAEVDATAMKADIDLIHEISGNASRELGRAIEHGGGDEREDAA